MDWLRRLSRNRLFDVGAAVIAILAVVRIAVTLPQRVGADDFAHYYIAGRIFNEGGDPYAVELTPYYARYGFAVPDLEQVRSPNMPAFFFLIGPVAALPVRVAYGVWMALAVGCLVAVLFLVNRLLRYRLSERGRYFVVLGAIASAPVFWHFFYAQVGLLLAALVLAGYAWHRVGHPVWGCVAVTVAGLVKLFMLPLGTLITQRQTAHA